MNDRSKSGAHGAPALIAAAALVIAGGGLARAAEAQATPTDTAPSVAAAEETGAAWFARPRLALSVGEGARAFRLRVFGFLEADYFFDTTRSYDDSMGTYLVARSDTYENTAGRSQFSLRSTRLGFGFDSPTVGNVSPSAVVEADFAGNQGTPPDTTESFYFDSPIFRVRHAYIKVKSPYLDVLMGHTFDVFGWQSYFDPSGLRNQLFSRNPQLRLSREFNSAGAVTVEVAAAAVRPVQRDSGVPDGAGGLRVSFNGWQGIRTPGNERIVAMPLTFAVSGIVRQLKLNAFTDPPIQTSNSVTSWGVSFDVFVPIIPATNFIDRGNRLALMGSYVRGTGIADLISMTGGAKFPHLPTPADQVPEPAYVANADDLGLATFDAQTRTAHTIDWTALRIGLQYYLPFTGRWIVSANYTQAHSANIARLYPQGGFEIGANHHVAETGRYGDAKLTYDITPVVRIGLAGQYTQTVYVDGDKPHNIRVSASTIYLF